MSNISVVIITKNEAANIVDCILSARKVSTDIIVVDSGSTDSTILLAHRESVKVEQISWQGYGHSRNIGAGLAINNWILALDADERITDELAAAISSVPVHSPNLVYGFKRVNYFGKQKIHFGALAHDRVFRVYHKNFCSWNLVPVHEKLNGENIKRITFEQPAIHYGISNKKHYRAKKEIYAKLCAEKYFLENKKNVRLLRMWAPAFNFLKAYIFQFGFLDMKNGLTIAIANARYTRLKYRLLQEMISEPKRYERIPAYLHSSLRKIISFLS